MRLRWRSNGTIAYAERCGYVANVIRSRMPPRSFHWWVCTNYSCEMRRATDRGLGANGHCDTRYSAMRCARLVLEALVAKGRRR